MTGTDETGIAGLPATVAWHDGRDGGHVRILDQRALPDRVEYRDLTTVEDVVDAIRSLAVRGANVIGTTGALGLALGIRQGLDARATAATVAAARPTAVNLQAAVDTVLAAFLAGDDPLTAALGLIARDREQCRRIGEFGRDELAGARTILTHCNAGALATTGWGTALGVIYAKAEAGQEVHVLSSETRPVRQGARLTVWELRRAGVDVTLIVDGAAASALAAGRVDAVVVGADRIAANGDTANKIGTLSHAVAARHAGVPFYVAATLNAIDPTAPDAAAIPIELRDGAEVRGTGPGAVDPAVPVWNPAFDLTPAELVTGIITEAGVLRPPFSESIAKVVSAS